MPEECIPAPERCRHGRAFRHDHRIRVVLQEVPSGRIMQPGGSVRSGLLPVDEGAVRFTLDIDQTVW